MSSSVAEVPAGAVPTGPVPVDLADRWLLGAASHLAVACGVDPSALPSLAEKGKRPDEPAAEPTGPESSEEAALAVLLAALAVEARLNQALRRCDPSDWRSTAHLRVVEKLGLAPRLLRADDHVEESTEHDALVDAAAMLFAVRAALGAEVELAPPDAIRARSLVQTAARICSYVSTLAVAEPDGETAVFVERVARRLAPRPRAPSADARHPRGAGSWSDVDFPPDVVGS
jgi:hypothetical protein